MIIKSQEKINRNNYQISENNWLTYIYNQDSYGNIIEVVCVSLEIKINNKWKTIIYYDSSHAGVLHRHTINSLETDTDVVDYLSVRKKGNQKRLLSWAIRDIKNKYIFYKKKFIIRCIRSGINIVIDIY